MKGTSQTQLKIPENTRAANMLGGAICVDLTSLSKYRSELMGIAILMIVFYHFCNRGGESVIENKLKFLISQGYVGVDFFMIVSGLGITTSLLKDDDLKKYYLKRWVRISPFFIFITLIECWIIRGEPFGLAIIRSTTLGYWFGFPYIDWFIPAIVGIYAIYPLIFREIIKPRKYWQALVLSLLFLGMSLVIALFNIHSVDWKHLAFLYRVPEFILGCVIATLIRDGYKSPDLVIKFVFTSVLSGIAVILIGKTVEMAYYTWFVNLFFTPFYLIILMSVLSLMSKSRVGIRLLSILSFLGFMTLEIYRISSSYERLLVGENCPNHHFLYVLLYLAETIILSYIAYRIFKIVNSYLYTKLSHIINIQ